MSYTRETTVHPSKGPCYYLTNGMRNEVAMRESFFSNIARYGAVADFKYGVNTDVNISVSVSRGGNTLFEVMGIC